MPDLYDQGTPTMAEDVAHLAAWCESQPPGRTPAALARLLEACDYMVSALCRVRQMRRAQREYFRSKGNLPTCRAMESRVDGLIKRWDGAPDGAEGTDTP